MKAILSYCYIIVLVKFKYPYQGEINEPIPASSKAN
jgi:hypothetical protein